MGGGAAGGLRSHKQWSPSWILPRIRNHVKTVTNGNFFALREKTSIFTQNWFEHLLLMTS